FLHRITSLSVAPAGAQTKDLDRLSVTLQSEVMSIPSAQEVQPTLQPDYTLLAKPLDDYRKSIVGRNLFSPPNNPPKLATTRNVDAVQGLRIDYAPDAKDPDAHHYISYQIEGEVPEGITIDPRTGKLNGTIRELGDYKFSIIATDSGFPAKSVTQLVTIRVKEPPVPPPPERKFDVASQSKLTGLVTGKNGAEGWVFSRTDGKTLKLKEGDEMKLGDVSGKVKKVGATYMVVETDGKEWTIGIDEIVSDAFKRGQVD
ncbi:MAG: cadherin repeat domain-containing protein, partial [Planctomycetes bacterium]|nr:cadherin repeat domain-containing protein [Planctomycetota bacterium]